MKRARITPQGPAITAVCEDVPACPVGRVVCTLRESASGRMVHARSFGEGADDAAAIAAARGALRGLLRVVRAQG